MSTTSDAAVAVARIDGVPLHAPGVTLAPDALRQRACTELLRQAAQREGLLAAADAPSEDGVISEAAAAAIEALLERALNVPEPSEEACRRHYEANRHRYRSGERVQARHILFAVTPGVNVVALRERAETCLLELRCHDGKPSGDFADAARALSNCPTGAQGGELGWLRLADCAPEFARELFGHHEVGVLPRLVHSRFGLHVVEILAREPGIAQSFDAVRGAVSLSLCRSAYVTALGQYLRVLAANAEVAGVDLDAADMSLAQ